MDNCRDITRTYRQAATLQASGTIIRAVAALEAGLFCNTPSQSDAGAHMQRRLFKKLRYKH